MAFLTCSTVSGALGKCFQYNVLIPDRHDENTRVLLLLHGLSDDYTVWQRYTEIERFADARGLCVIMPDGGRSFYTDMKYGPAYYTSIVRDVMQSARSIFNLTDKREKNFTAGLSMGGYGALKIALKNPDMFAGCVSLSGVVDIAGRAESRLWEGDFSLIWGEDYYRTVRGSEDDIEALMDSYKGTDKKKPKIYSACGSSDFMIEDNRRFADFLAKSDFVTKYEEFPGDHNWTFWNTHLCGGLDFIMAE